LNDFFTSVFIGGDQILCEEDNKEYENFLEEYFCTTNSDSDSDTDSDRDSDSEWPVSQLLGDSICG